jgi:TetR/AcrR family transcriptional regulator
MPYGYRARVGSAPRQRDAERSRAAILGAAETVFAARGPAAATMDQIAREAGVARATPGYFFGSKEGLYRAVLERVHAERGEALRAACQPMHQWAADPEASRDGLHAAVASAVDGYVGFLLGRPAFARLIEWEALGNGSRLRVDPAGPLSEALGAVHAAGRQRGVRDFDVTVVVVALVSLCFLPIAHATTFAAGGAIDTVAPAFRHRYQAQVVDSVMTMVTG